MKEQSITKTWSLSISSCFQSVRPLTNHIRVYLKYSSKLGAELRYSPWQSEFWVVHPSVYQCTNVAQVRKKCLLLLKGLSGHITVKVIFFLSTARDSTLCSTLLRRTFFSLLDERNWEANLRRAQNRSQFTAFTFVLSANVSLAEVEDLSAWIT